jgi:HK97 family phage prohead protease
MPGNLISLDQFRADFRAGRAPAGAVQRLATAEPVAFADAQRKIRLCFSDGSVDRMGDTIAPDGWEIAAFMHNPVVLWAHDAMTPPIGRASNIAVEGERLMGDVEFAAPEVYPFAETIYQLVRSRFLGACSVGFAPLEYSFSRDPDRPFGIDFERQELLELSIVPIPANANALVQRRAAGGSRAQAGRRERAALESREEVIERLRTPGRRADPSRQPEFQGFCGPWIDRHLPSIPPGDAGLAGCAIDRQRERYRQQQREQIERQIRCLHLGRRSERPSQRQAYVEELERLQQRLADWR